MKTHKTTKTEVVAQKGLETGGKTKGTIPTYDSGFAQGFKLALECHPDVESSRRLAFDQGVKYIVTLAENFLVEHEKLASRDELRGSDFNKLPSWWIATLVTALHYELPSVAVPNTSRIQETIT